MQIQIQAVHRKCPRKRVYLANLKEDARIDRIYISTCQPFAREPRLRIPAYDYQSKHESMKRIPQLGFTVGIMVQPFNTPSYQQVSEAPYIEYELDLLPTDSVSEIRTLPTLHVYDGRDARYAVQIGDNAPTLFSIHANDFTAEWRWNVLRGYASRSLPVAGSGQQRLRIYLLDPGIVILELLVHSKVFN